MDAAHTPRVYHAPYRGYVQQLPTKRRNELSTLPIAPPLSVSLDTDKCPHLWPKFCQPLFFLIGPELVDYSRHSSKCPIPRQWLGS